MNKPAIATAHTITTRMSTSVRAATVSEDLIGWVASGCKRLLAPHGEIRIHVGGAFALPRFTQWDVTNEPDVSGRYEARVISFSLSAIEAFHDRFGQFLGLSGIRSCRTTSADEPFVSTFAHAAAALQSAEVSDTLREHRALEVLLILAERGLTFEPARDMRWAERVCRLVGQRTYAAWSVDGVASALHVSPSTLQRRLGEEGTSVRQCLREVRLEAAMAMLLSTGLHVSEISDRCGYESHSRFSAAFRERFGFTPSQLRAGTSA
jgi:AraC-like DNA-binding protein